jgi:hypothetical protein
MPSRRTKCKTTKYMKLDKSKWDSRNEARKNYETKRNFTFDETKRNETKRNFAVFIVSRNKRNFAKQFCCFALFRVSRNKKKGCEMETLGGRFVQVTYCPGDASLQESRGRTVTDSGTDRQYTLLFTVPHCRLMGRPHNLLSS